MLDGKHEPTELPEFLRTKSNRAIKRELRGLLQSYHHYWDILSELLQNSRDAIERRWAQEAEAGQALRPGRIHISVDASDRSVEVIDNGTGIRADFVSEVLAPGGGDKSATDELVGEKGVGLTYVAFSGDVFRLRTRTLQDATDCTMTGASSWVNAHEDESVPPPSLDFSDAPITPEGFASGPFTSIRIAGVPKRASTDLFVLSGEELKWILRTRTAVGDTRAVLREAALPDIEVTYSWTSVDGEKIDPQPQPIELGYPDLAGAHALPIEEVNSVLVGKNDAVARKYLHSKVVIGRRAAKVGADTVRVFGIMLPGNKAVDLIAAANHLDGNDDRIETPLVTAGIFVVTKSMPTGIQIEPAARGAYPAYYKRCIFLVESDRIDFDLGRKSMHWTHKKRLQDAVAELFVQFERVAKYQNPADASGLAPSTETSAERKHRVNKEWEKAERNHDLNWPGVAFSKVPTGQEAAVAALFHELLGSGGITGIRPLATGYSTQYDLLAHYVGGNKPLRIVVEFKDKLESILSDFRDGIKSVGDVDLLVCWDAKLEKIAEVGLSLTTCVSPPYDGVTHDLNLPAEVSPEPIPVIVLKSLLEKKLNK